MTPYLERQERYVALTERALRGYFDAKDIPAPLLESMSYSVFAGGKRLRPCLVLSACALCGGREEDALPFACALELIHTYSLIHDDLPAMDNDDYRRGRLTSHKVFGEGQAVLAGDGLLSYAFEIMLGELVRREAVCFRRAAAAIAGGAGVRGMVAGQCLDLQHEGDQTPDETALHEIHRGKTAAMIIAAVEAGAYCAGADESTVSGLRAFGEHYGLLFQVTDDILDVTGDSKDLGKSAGKDAQAGKLTFPAVYGLPGAKQKAGETAKAALLALEPFGERAWYLRELVGATLTRKA